VTARFGHRGVPEEIETVATSVEMTPPDDDRLLVVADVARMTQLSTRTIRDLIKHPTHPLPALKLPGSSQHRFRRQVVLDWIARQENGGKPDA
jgi:predicted DNA-binding transcriptional regulator AlpA